MSDVVEEQKPCFLLTSSYKRGSWVKYKHTIISPMKINQPMCDALTLLFLGSKVILLVVLLIFGVEEEVRFASMVVWLHWKQLVESMLLYLPA
jgi:hypothetical protein